MGAKTSRTSRTPRYEYVRILDDEIYDMYNVICDISEILAQMENKNSETKRLIIELQNKLDAHYDRYVSKRDGLFQQTVKDYNSRNVEQN